VHAVCETHAFRRAAAKAGMSEEDIFGPVSYLAQNPTAGDVIVGTGGCRKRAGPAVARENRVAIAPLRFTAAR
jgi:hypothetical protein